MTNIRISNITANPLKNNFVAIDLRTIEGDYIVVKPLLVGICRSDIKELQLIRPKRSDFGHEIVGLIEDISFHDTFQKGDKVVFWPENKINRTSGFGNFILAQGNKESITKAFIKVPTNIPDERVVFCEPLSCAFHCVMNLKKHIPQQEFTNKSIAIVGAGNSGTLMALIIIKLGGSLALFNRGSERLEFLLSKKIFDSKDLHSLSNVNDFNNCFDAVIDTSSFIDVKLIHKTVTLLKPNGIYELFGGTKEGMRFLNLDLDTIRRNEQRVDVNNSSTPFSIIGTYGSTEDDFYAILNFISDYQDLPLESLIEMYISDDNLFEKFKELKEGAQYNKILVRYTP